MVSLARKFLTFTGPSSLVLLTAEIQKERVKKLKRRMKFEMRNNPLHKSCSVLFRTGSVSDSLEAYLVGISECIQRGGHCFSLVGPIPE